MKKLILIIVCGFLSSFLLLAQDKSPNNDISLVSIKAIIPVQVGNIPESSKGLLINKMRQMLSANGLGAYGINDQFILTVKVDEISKLVTPTAPPTLGLTLGLNFYIIDYKDKKIYSSYYREARGGGRNEIKAYKSALRNIPVNNKEIKQFIDQGKNEIINYYEKRCDLILKKAESLAEMKEYKKAMFYLITIPEACKICYEKAIPASNAVYQKYIDHQCTEYLTKAKTIWAANQNYAGASEAGKWLSWIEPGAACYDDAMRFVETIKKKVLADENRQWDFVMKRYDADDNIEQQRIRAIRDIGVAYGEGQPDVNYNLKEIFR